MPAEGWRHSEDAIAFELDPLQMDILEVMYQARIPEELIYAYLCTGLLVTEENYDYMQAGQPDRLLTVDEAARYLGRSARAVRHLIAEGILPVVREGRSVHLDRHELDRRIELRQSPGVS